MGTVHGHGWVGSPGVQHRLQAAVAIAGAIVLSSQLDCATSQDHLGGASARQGTATLPEGVVARVGGLDISSEMVLATASAQGVSATAALQHEIHDALFAAGALARHIELQPWVRASLRGHLARALLARIKAEASVAPPTDEEVAAMTALHFVELDRPEASQVIHAVVRVGSQDDSTRKARARELAEQIARAASSATTADEFRKSAEQVDCAPFERKVEALKAVAEDGRVVDLHNPRSTERYAITFAQAAARLREIGQKSNVVETSFGFHVLMLLERQPELRVPLDERRRVVADEIVTERARERLDETVRRLRTTSPPRIEHATVAILQGLSIP